MFNGRPSRVSRAAVTATPKLQGLRRNIGDAIFVSEDMILDARSELHHMTPRPTLRLDRHTVFGFGRHTAGTSTPTGALASDVCASWPLAAAVAPTSDVVARDRAVGQTQTGIERKLAIGGQYTPALQSQSRIGAGTEGGGRSTS